MNLKRLNCQPPPLIFDYLIEIEVSVGARGGFMV